MLASQRHVDDVELWLRRLSPFPPAKTSSMDERSPLSIVIVTTFYPPYVGGSEVHTGRLSAALAHRGASVAIFTVATPLMPSVNLWTDASSICPLDRTEHPPEATTQGLRAQRCNPFDRAPAEVPDCAFLRAQYTLLGVLAAKFAWPWKPVIVFFPSSADATTLQSKVRRRVQLSVIRTYADRIVVLNPEMRRDFAALGFSPERIVSIPAGADPVMFAPVNASARRQLRARLALPAHAVIVAYAGSFAVEKHLPDLVAAFDAVHVKHPDAFLILAGNDHSPMNSPDCRSQRPHTSGTFHWISE